MLQIECDWLNCLDDVRKHGKIGWYKLGPGWPILIGGVEDVRYLREISKLLAAIVSIKQINGHMSNMIC